MNFQLLAQAQCRSTYTTMGDFYTISAVAGKSSHDIKHHMQGSLIFSIHGELTAKLVIWQYSSMSLSNLSARSSVRHVLQARSSSLSTLISAVAISSANLFGGRSEA